MGRKSQGQPSHVLGAFSYQGLYFVLVECQLFTVKKLCNWEGNPTF